MAACLPEQFMCTGSGLPPSLRKCRMAVSSSGSAGGHCSASSVRPALARILRTPVTWKSSPEWLAAASASNSPSRSRPKERIPAACTGLLDDLGYMGEVTSPALKSTSCPSAPSTTAEPWCRDSVNPDRMTSAITGMSATFPHPKHRACLVGPHRRPLCEARERGRPLHELKVAGYRAAPGERSRVLHADPQVTASGQGGEHDRQRRAAD